MICKDKSTRSANLLFPILEITNFISNLTNYEFDCLSLRILMTGLNPPNPPVYFIKMLSYLY